MEKKRNRKLLIRFIAIGILTVCVAGLIYLVGISYDTQPLPVDKEIQNVFFGLRNEVLNFFVKGITHLGDSTTIIALCAVLLILPSRKIFGLPVSLGALAGLAVYKPMKEIFLRARPDVSLHLVEQGGYSFPSGHSVTSVIVYGLLFYLLRKYCKKPHLRRIFSGICLFLAVAIGISRIYVGVHWPSDVFTGWCIGGILLLLEITILERIGEKNESI